MFLCIHLWKSRLLFFHKKMRYCSSLFLSSRALLWYLNEYNSDVIMGAMASQITSLMIVYSTVYSCADQRKHQSSASLAFVRGIHRWPVNSLHRGPVTLKMLRFDDVSMKFQIVIDGWHIPYKLAPRWISMDLMATLLHVIGAVRQQAIIWSSVNQDLRHYMASLGHSKLIHYALC